MTGRLTGKGWTWRGAIESVNRFLKLFGRTREVEDVGRRAQAVTGAAGSRAWYPTEHNRSERLLNAGQAARAAVVFTGMLERRGISPSKCLNNLANLLETQLGRQDEARRLAEEALAIKRTLEPGERAATATPWRQVLGPASFASNDLRAEARAPDDWTRHGVSPFHLQFRLDRDSRQLHCQWFGGSALRPEGRWRCPWLRRRRPGWRRKTSGSTCNPCWRRSSPVAS